MQPPESMKVTVSTSEYRSNHGAHPRGRGTWKFALGNGQGVWLADSFVCEGTFTTAKRAAAREARRLGLVEVAVLS